MIQVTCTSCKTLLEVDDAFAGGVCRCSHCGAIQTLPAASPDDQRAARPKAKTLYRKQGQAVVGSGLDELAQVVASSGLTSARHKPPRNPSAAAEGTGTPAAPPVPRRVNPLPWIVGGGCGIALLLTVFLLTRSESAPPAPQADPEVATVAGPAFATLDLARHRSVVFLIDRGTSSAPVLSPLKVITLRAAASLGHERQFAIVFWSAGSGDVSYPARGLAHSVEESLAAARRTLEDVVPFGQTDALGPLETALSHGVDAVVIATAKGFDLDEVWAERAMQLRTASRSPTAVIHAVSIGSSPESIGLRRVSERTGGRYVELSPSAVRELGSE